MRLTVGKRAFAIQVGKRLFAIPRDVKGNRLRRRLGRDLQQLHIFRIVFDNQNILGTISLSGRHVASMAHLFASATEPTNVLFYTASDSGNSPTRFYRAFQFP